MLHPTRYADLLADKIRRHNAQAWLVNTGWTGGPYGVGSRIKLAYTRAIVDAIHDGSLSQRAHVEDALLAAPDSHVAARAFRRELLSPRNTWADPSAYDRTATQARRASSSENFAKLRGRVERGNTAGGSAAGISARVTQRISKSRRELKSLSPR